MKNQKEKWKKLEKKNKYFKPCELLSEYSNNDKKFYEEKGFFRRSKVHITIGYIGLSTHKKLRKKSRLKLSVFLEKKKK